jgi:hypothetical protein
MKNEITGEMIENLVDSIGMREQLLRQLVLSASDDELRNLYHERKELLMNSSSTKTVRIEAEITQIIKASIEIEIPNHVEDGNVFDYLHTNHGLWQEKIEHQLVYKSVPEEHTSDYWYRVIGLNGDIVYGGLL